MDAGNNIPLEDTPAAADGNSNSLPPLLLFSKKQQKKLLKQQRAAQAKRDRKERQRQERRAQALAEGRDLEAEEAYRIQRTLQGDGKRRRQQEWDTNKSPLAQQQFRICLDCSFEQLMTAKEIASLASQLRYCYSYNKKSPNPSLWAATSLSLGGPIMGHLQKETGFEEWPHRAFVGTPQSLEEYYVDQHDKIVYLTSDSDHTLTHLQDDHVYVIGGLVDRNRCKGAALERATSLGLPTAKLPLEEHLKKMPSTRVLTCNHVFDILLKAREFQGDWGRALRAVLPGRKEAEFVDQKKKEEEV